MQIKKITLHHFRNYEAQEIELTPDVNLFFGENGQGKTNLLEAVFIGSMGKSFRAKKENEVIKIGENQARIEIQYERKDRSGTIVMQFADKKQVFINGVKIQKLSDLLGKIPIVIFTPDDLAVLKNGPNLRRRFLDMMIGQLRPNYIHYLNLYRSALEQRNHYLRQIKLDNKNSNILEIWDEKLAEYAEKVFSYRMEFTNKLKEKISDIHSEITQNRENIVLKYQSDFKNKEQFIQKMKKSHAVDILKGYTTVGIHRDDFSLFINEQQLNIYGSQGQHRTAVLSLKVAELKIMQEEIGENPILLLDDFMSELDENRRSQFLKNLKNIQVLVTCTDPLYLENLCCKIYQVENGRIQEK